MRRLGLTVGWLLGLVAVGLMGVGIAARLSPRPASVVIRRRFDRNGTERLAATARFVPPHVASVLDVPYRQGDRDARLDVHRSTTPGPARPTIVWVHGGAWLSGSKDLIANYLRVLAGDGSAVVGIGYSIAPRATYPTQALQVLDALAFLTEHADELGIDARRLVLAGDSAGAQIAAQVVGMVTNPAYAAMIGARPRITPDQIVGTVLFCGVFDMSLARGLRGRDRWFVDSVMRSFTGTTAYLDDPRFDGISVVGHVTADFPRTLVSCGSADIALGHSLSLVAELERLGVPHETLFFADDHEPPVGHEFQLLLGTDAGQEALSTIHRFVADLPGS
ncbi:alpha/beta hydrolase [Cellulomonas fengjieae]|uniref:Alpha/beta hydrolase n=1 Tax=Cellulomonas fengjieae TaxID=2819978 RepID=A0ABS3SBR9_9CELL|nr:alpha/beta hydrolase [Cellulomonas fengjieae]MBO3083191.1 alpha/beta hydrolase [Cellulomonas fengjieae]MBO3102062.1 alpha/beta hydrolase [Cellulomonas fengjieae]QVI65452.1 alpha/beta hydrolase [Cellulomonas fengjieae]